MQITGLNEKQLVVLWDIVTNSEAAYDDLEMNITHSQVVDKLENEITERHINTEEYDLNKF